MAPTINRRKLVATAITAFVSIMAATPMTRRFEFFLFFDRFEFQRADGCQAQCERTMNGATGRSHMEGKAVRLTASDSGTERVSIKKYKGGKSSASYRVINLVRGGTGWGRVHELS
jgi:hypothetical protein